MTLVVVGITLVNPPRRIFCPDCQKCASRIVWDNPYAQSREMTYECPDGHHWEPGHYRTLDIRPMT